MDSPACPQHFNKLLKYWFGAVDSQYVITIAAHPGPVQRPYKECEDFISSELIRSLPAFQHPRILIVNDEVLPEARIACACRVSARVDQEKGRLNFPSSSFEIIYSRTLMSSVPVPELRRTLMRLIWLLAPGGRLLLTGCTDPDGAKLAWTQASISKVMASIPDEALSGYVVTVSPSGQAIFLDAQA